MLKILADPIWILCIIILVGYIIGKIKICGFSFDISTILPIGILAGIALSNIPIDIDIKNILSTAQTLSSLGTVLFIAAIGLTSGKLLCKKFSKIHLCGFFIGVIMVISSILTMKFLDPFFDHSTLAGILCGALTSTPGLATLSEFSHINHSAATIGYGSAYLFGVLGIVLFVQIVCRSIKNSPIQQMMDQSKCNAELETKDFMVLLITIVFGKAIGCISIPFLDFSLGSSGGILCCGIFLGFLKKAVADYTLFRNIGLLLFLSGTGVSAGIHFSSTAFYENLLVGMLLTMIPILIGYILCRVLKISTLISLGIVAGGMTSSPALGVLVENDAQATIVSVYSMSYLGALCTIIFGMRFL